MSRWYNVSQTGWFLEWTAQLAIVWKKVKEQPGLLSMLPSNKVFHKPMDGDPGEMEKFPRR